MAARRLTPGGRTSTRPARGSIAERLAAEAIRRGANLLDVEYKEGYDDVYAAKGNEHYAVGYTIARLESSSPEAVSLRKELHRIASRKKHRIVVDGCQYELRCRVYDSFGEDAFHVQLRRA